VGPEDKETQRILWGIHDELERDAAYNERRLADLERQASAMRTAVDLGAVRLSVVRDTIKALTG
jgi:hypothetical protein